MKALIVNKHLLASLLLLMFLAVMHGMSWSEPQRPTVYLAKIDGTIDPGLAPYVQRVLQQAQDDKAVAVVLQINTFGGQLDAAVKIRDALIKSPVNSIAFVDSRAISAGALISLAATSIVMAPDGTLGAATPVLSDGSQVQTASEKTISYVRKEFGATAQFRHRDPTIAEAMVDPDVVIAGLSPKGKLLTLTTQEALELGIADFQASTLEQALTEAGIGNARIIETETNWAEELIRFLTNPVISSLLITIAMVGILVEIRTPGLGLAGFIGLAALGLFMGSHWLVELAGLEELLLLAGGIALLLLEIFVIPGFGIAGVLGALAMLAALLLTLTGEGASWQALLQAATQIALALVAAIAISLLLLRFLPRTAVGRKLVLQTGLDAASGFTSAPASDHELLGQTGVATTPLRPAGMANIGGRRIDVVSRGEFIEPGTTVKVVNVEGNRIVVEQIAAPTLHSGEV